jgi:folate-binding protein YgfZ
LSFLWRRVAKPLSPVHNSEVINSELDKIHSKYGARFGLLNDVEIVSSYGDTIAEYHALTNGAGILDLSFRGRLCVIGADRARFLHGQVTNDINRLKPGQGCYAALISAKGRMESDLNILCLADEFLLDFEPGLTGLVTARLEKYVIADDAQIVDVSPQFGLLSVQGPRAHEVVMAAGLCPQIPVREFESVRHSMEGVDEFYVVNLPRLGSAGVELFIPVTGIEDILRRLLEASGPFGGRMCGWDAFENARIEADIPRFGQDMDDSNLPLEAGIAGRAISVTKGCYIGQEVISRVRNYSEAARALRGFRLEGDLVELPARGTKLFHEGKEAGYLTSVTKSPAIGKIIALGYVRKEFYRTGAELKIGSPTGDASARITELPFMK